MVVNDCQTFGGILENIEKISSIVARYSELETRVLIRTSALTKELSVALVKLYAATLRFLAQARRYYRRSTFSKHAIIAFTIRYWVYANLNGREGFEKYNKQCQVCGGRTNA
jgi:hypothetical protein